MYRLGSHLARLHMVSVTLVALYLATQSPASAWADAPQSAIAAVVAKVKPAVVKVISVRQAAMPPTGHRRHRGLRV